MLENRKHEVNIHVPFENVEGYDSMKPKWITDWNIIYLCSVGPCEYQNC